MECSEPGLIREEELLAYLVGERVRSVVEQHLTRCPHCSARLEDFRRLELSFVSKLYRWDCPPGLVLGEYQLGLLDAETALAVRFHLRACVSCVAELGTLKHFLVNDPLLAEQTPSLLFAQPTLQNHYHPQTRQAGATLKHVLDFASTGTRRIIASLLPPAPRLAYQRTAASPDLWPRHYAAEDFQVSLQVERETGHVDTLQLIGFVTRKDTSLESLLGVPVRLLSGAEMVSTQQVDELGNFIFSALVPALYDLELQASHGVVVIEQIPVELSAP